jgi:hypothetical protein
MNQFIELTYLDVNNKRIKRLINTLHVFDVISNPRNEGALIRFVPTNDYEKTYPVAFEAIEAYEEVKRLIQD